MTSSRENNVEGFIVTVIMELRVSGNGQNTVYCVDNNDDLLMITLRTIS